MLILELIQGRECTIFGGTEYDGLKGEIIDVTDSARPILVLIDGNEVEFLCSEVEII